MSKIKRTKAERKAAARLAGAKWRETAAGKRRAKRLAESHADRIERINANMPPAMYDVMNR